MSASLASFASFVCWGFHALPNLCSFPLAQFDVQDLLSSAHSLPAEFVHIYDTLVLQGATVADLAAPPGAPGAAPPADPDLDEPSPPDLRLLPLEALAPLVDCDLPLQLDVTAFLLARWGPRRLAIAAAPQQQKDALAAQAEQVFDCSDPSLTPLVQLGLDGLPTGTVRFAPTAHVWELDCAQGQCVSKREWLVWACMSWGLPPGCCCSGAAGALQVLGFLRPARPPHPGL
jgi:hypothetical protein